MHIERIVTICLEAIERGATVEECLARYPAHAQEVAPLLQLALSLREQPKPRMSDRAFHAGRAAVAAAARRAQARRLSNGSTDDIHAAPMGRNGSRENGTPSNGMLYNGMSNGTQPDPIRGTTLGPTGQIEYRADAPEIGHRTPDRRRSLVARARATGAANRRRGHGRRGTQGSGRRISTRGQRHVHALLAWVVVLLCLFSTAALVHQIRVSAPGTALYEVKTVGQQAQGVLMRAAGEGAAWHARQATQRIAELEQYSPQTEAATAATVAQIEDHVQQALAAAALDAGDQQRQFYTTWLNDLARVEGDLQRTANANPIAVTTVAQVIAQVTSAADAQGTIEIIPDRMDSEPTTPAPITPTEQGLDGATVEQDNVGLPTTATPLPATETIPTAEIGTTTAVGTVTNGASDGQSAPSAAETLPVTADPATMADGAVAPASVSDTTPTPILRATPLPPMNMAMTRTAPSRPIPTATPLPVITRVMPMQSDEDDPDSDAGVDESSSGAEDDRERQRLDDDGAESGAAEERGDDAALDSSTDEMNGDTDSPAVPTQTAFPTDGSPTTATTVDARGEGTATPGSQPLPATPTFVPTQPTEPAMPPVPPTPATPTPATTAPAAETPDSDVPTPMQTTVSTRRTLQATPDMSDEATPEATAVEKPGGGEDATAAPTPETEAPSATTAPQPDAPQQPATTPESAATEAAASEPRPTEEPVRPRRTRRPLHTETPVSEDEEAAYLD